MNDILIVDDEKDIRELISEILLDEGYSTRLAGNSAECLDEVLEIHSLVKPKKTILTNLNNEMDYKQLKRKLPSNVIPAYDGMTLKI